MARVLLIAMHEPFSLGVGTLYTALAARKHQDRKTSNATYLAVIKKYLKAHLPVRLQFIGGHPLQSEAVVEATLDFIRAVAQLRTKVFPRITLVNSYFYPLRHAPVVVKYSLPLSNSYDKKKWLYEGLLLEARLVCTDADFQAIRREFAYREDPFLLQARLPGLRQTWEESCLAHAASALDGKEVLFWGNGEAYKARRHVFRASRPVAMVLDAPYAAQTGGMCDGLPVVTPDQAIAGWGSLPLVLFVHESNAEAMVRKIYRLYPELAAGMTVVPLWRF